jgi:hypothetical protein
MLLLLWTGALFLASVVGSIRLRHADNDRYRRFVFGLASGWALIPATTGHWLWLFATIPASAFVASLIVSRRAKT